MYVSRIQRRPGSEREIRENHDRSLSSSQAYNPQKETSRNSKPSQKATSRQELERFASFRPRLWHVWRVTLTRKFAVGQTLASDLRHCLRESLRRGDLVPESILSVVESERLFIHVPKQVIRLNRHVGATESALQQAPKVFQPIRVNCTVHIFFEMVNDLV